MIDLINEVGIGKVVDFNNDPSKQIISFLTSENLYKHPRDYIVKNYDWKEIVLKYISY